MFNLRTKNMASFLKFKCIGCGKHFLDLTYVSVLLWFSFFPAISSERTNLKKVFALKTPFFFASLYALEPYSKCLIKKINKKKFQRLNKEFSWDWISNFLSNSLKHFNIVKKLIFLSDYFFVFCLQIFVNV